MAAPRPVLHCYGVRGSIPAAGKEYDEFGGNTASFVVRSPSGSRIFLDAGTGLLRACEEQLKDIRSGERVHLLLSHTHADHIYGLGMSGLRWICQRPGAEGVKTAIWGPPGVRPGLDQFYDGRYTWPIIIGKGSSPSDQMPCFAPDAIRGFGDGASVKIDPSTTVRMMIGSHPVEGGVLLYRLDFTTDSGPVAMVYATDNEFDFLPGPVPNPSADRLKQTFTHFIDGADLLLTDAQYSRAEYIDGVPRDHRGYGHPYLEQAVDLAAAGRVKRLLVTHHARRTDTELHATEESAKKYARSAGHPFPVDFAREGMRVSLG